MVCLVISLFRTDLDKDHHYRWYSVLTHPLKKKFSRKYHLPQVVTFSKSRVIILREIFTNKNEHLKHDRWGSHCYLEKPYYGAPKWFYCRIPGTYVPPLPFALARFRCDRRLE